METAGMGSFKVELFLDQMPLTASNWIDLAKTGFYDARFGTQKALQLAIPPLFWGKRRNQHGLMDVFGGIKNMHLVHQWTMDLLSRFLFLPVFVSL